MERDLWMTWTGHLGDKVQHASSLKFQDFTQVLWSHGFNLSTQTDTMKWPCHGKCALNTNFLQSSILKLQTKMDWTYTWKHYVDFVTMTAWIQSGIASYSFVYIKLWWSGVANLCRAWLVQGWVTCLRIKLPVQDIYLGMWPATQVNTASPFLCG